MFGMEEFLFRDVRRKIGLQPSVKQHPDLFVSFKSHLALLLRDPGARPGPYLELSRVRAK